MAYSDDSLSAIYDRTSGYCHICGKKLAFTNYAKPGKRGAWEVEHSVARASGGTGRLNNLYAACIPCNCEKRDVSTRAARARNGRTRAPLCLGRNVRPRRRATPWSEARFEKEEGALRKHVAECCLVDAKIAEPFIFRGRCGAIRLTPSAESESATISAQGVEGKGFRTYPGGPMKFSGSRESVWGPVGNVGVTTGPRKTAPELSDSLVNDPLWVNAPVPTGPQRIFSNRAFVKVSF